MRMARARRVAVGETELRRRVSEAIPWETVHDTLCEDARRLLRVSDSRTRRVQFSAREIRRRLRVVRVRAGCKAQATWDAVGLSA